jgi:ribosome-associated translation inhibitor RaiA
MKLPVQVTFRDLVPLPSLESDIRRRAAEFERFAPDLMSCHVAVQSAANRHQQGHVYTVGIDLRIRGEEIFAGEHHADQDIAVALRGAFDAVTRRLEDHVRRRRGQTKHHAADARASANGDGGPPCNKP